MKNENYQKLLTSDKNEKCDQGLKVEKKYGGNGIRNNEQGKKGVIKRTIKRRKQKEQKDHSV